MRKVKSKYYLRPCPFCGGIPREWVGMGDIRFYTCGECGAITSFDNKYLEDDPERSYKFWNRREQHV